MSEEVRYRDLEPETKSILPLVTILLTTIVLFALFLVHQAS